MGRSVAVSSVAVVRFTGSSVQVCPRGEGQFSLYGGPGTTVSVDSCRSGTTDPPKPLSSGHPSRHTSSTPPRDTTKYRSRDPDRNRRVHGPQHPPLLLLLSELSTRVSVWDVPSVCRGGRGTGRRRTVPRPLFRLSIPGSVATVGSTPLPRPNMEEEGPPFPSTRTLLTPGPVTPKPVWGRRTESKE